MPKTVRVRKRRKKSQGERLTRGELIRRSLESGTSPYVERVHEAKLYFTAFWKAVRAGQVIDLTQGPEPVIVEDDSIADADRWRIGDEFLAKYQDGIEEDGLSAPSLGDPFRADSDTQEGDAERTYNRLMTEKFGERPK